MRTCLYCTRQTHVIQLERCQGCGAPLSVVADSDNLVDETGTGAIIFAQRQFNQIDNYVDFYMSRIGPIVENFYDKD